MQYRILYIQARIRFDQYSTRYSVTVYRVTAGKRNNEYDSRVFRVAGHWFRDVCVFAMVN